jgi:periplasmic divalent cation tolerance protein
MKPVVVLTTVGADFDARQLAESIVEARLAACVNIVDRIRSIYRWQGAIEDDREQLLIIKTSEERVDALRAAIVAGHPYDVPEFVVIQIDDLSESYRAWLVDALHVE